MTKTTLKQYEHLLSELEEERARFSKRREEATMIEYTYGAYSLFGVDEELRRAEARVKENAAIHCTAIAEIRLWIETIKDSQIRRAFKLRYVDGRSWADASRRMGYNDESGARKICERYLATKSDETNI